MCSATRVSGHFEAMCDARMCSAPMGSVALRGRVSRADVLGAEGSAALRGRVSRADALGAEGFRALGDRVGRARALGAEGVGSL